MLHSWEEFGRKQSHISSTRGYVSAAGWLDWLMTLPLEVRLTLPDGTRLLGVHASPGRDDGPGIQPKHSEEL